MTPDSEEKPLRLSTGWQLSDLWGLRKGRKISPLVGMYPRFQEGIKNLESRSACLSSSQRFHFPSDFFFLSSKEATISPSCSLLCTHMYAHAFEHILYVLCGGKNTGSCNPNSDPFSDTYPSNNMDRLFNLFSLSFLIYQMGVMF